MTNKKSYVIMNSITGELFLDPDHEVMEFVDEYSAYAMVYLVLGTPWVVRTN